MAQPSGHLGKGILKIYELHEDLKAWLEAEADAQGRAATRWTLGGALHRRSEEDFRAVLDKIEELENHYE